MSERDRTLWEQLRQATWQVLILRDRLLKVAEDLPSPDRERAKQAAGKLVSFCTQLREVAENLEVHPEADEMDGEFTAGQEDLRLRLEVALEGFDQTLEELSDIAGDSGEEEEAISEQVH